MKKTTSADKTDNTKYVKNVKSVKPAKKVVKEKKPTDKLADKTLMTRILQGVFGDAQKKILRRMYKKVLEINKLEPKYEKMSDEELAKQRELLKEQLKEGTEKELDAILADSFAMSREASKRILGMRPFDVQLIGGIALHEGNVAEMKTGEGKTLVALSPAVLNALTGRGVHVVTVNDYLAQRDAGWNAPVYHFLGLSVGVIINQASFVYDPEYENEDHEDERFRHLKPATRKEAYAADITYGTNNEFGFDYLRDNMVSEPQYLRQRGLNYAIVDEVDSILIDEARTPLIISAPAGDNPDALKRNTSFTHAGDIIIEVAPGWQIIDDGTGRASGALRHTAADIPAFFVAPGLKRLQITENTDARILAPTLSRLLLIRAPNGASVPPINL